jgi:hypothetical protein
VYTCLGLAPFFTHTAAALPTTSPIMAQVFITLTGPNPDLVTLIHLPAINKFLIFLLYNSSWHCIKKIKSIANTILQQLV